MGDGDIIDYCRECNRPLGAGDMYIWNGAAYCVVCINIVSARGGGWRE